MKTKILKKDNGFTGTDIIISLIIVIVFMSIITTSFYNYYASIQSKNRHTIATNIMIDVIENVEMMEYTSLNQTTLNELIKNLKDDGTIESPYNVTATIEKYNERTGNEHKEDLIKILNVKVQYTSNNKQESYEVTRLITK